MATHVLPPQRFRLRPGKQRDWILYAAVLLLGLWVVVVAYVFAQFGRFGESLEQEAEKNEGASPNETRPLK